MKKFFLSFATFGIMLCILATTFCASLTISTTAIMPAKAEIDLQSKSACLMEYSSGEILFAKNEKEHLPVASMVKMMTILLTLEEIDNGNLTLDTMITTSENASGMGGSQVFIDPYVEYKTDDLLKSVIMASANDASVALAEHMSGSEKTFAIKMNNRAKELGMNDTNYVNCTGLPAPEQYSCAYDSAILLKEVSSHELYHKYSTIWMDELLHPSGRKTELVNTNRLIRYYEGCDGGKTGSTNEAGCCLSASAKRNDMRLVSVIVGAANSQTRFNECSALFNYGFANFESRSLVDNTTSCQTLPVTKGKVAEVDVYAKENFAVVLKKGEKGGYEVTYALPSNIKAPTKAGDAVGKAIVSKDGVVVKEVELVVKENLEKLSYKNCIDKIVAGW